MLTPAQIQRLYEIVVTNTAKFRATYHGSEIINMELAPKHINIEQSFIRVQGYVNSILLEHVSAQDIHVYSKLPIDWLRLTDSFLN